MKKVLALVLAVAMIATLNVVAMAGGGELLIAPEGVVPDISAFAHPVLNVGETLQLYLYTYNREYVANQDLKWIRYTDKVTWTSSNKEYITVSETGLITAVHTKDTVASARITAITPDYSPIDIEIKVIGGEMSLEVKPTTLTMTVGETKSVKGILKENGKEVPKELSRNLFWQSSNYNVLSIPNETGDTPILWAMSAGTSTVTVSYFIGDDRIYSASCVVTVVPLHNSTNPPDNPTPPVIDPEDPEQPTTPTTPADPTTPTDPTNPTPKPPVVDSGAREDKSVEATQNAANDDKTTDALKAGNAVEVKVSNGSSAISTETANLLGGGSGKLTLVNSGMTVVLPGGFGKVTEAGRIYYPFDFEQNPARAADILSGVKGDSAKSEAVKAGGVMTLPTTATVTLKTKLTGTVNVYWYNEDTGRYTLVASPVAKDGTVTFTTRQMGYFLLTTGRV